VKEYLRSLVRTSANPVEARNQVREYLQARLLGSLQNEGAMIPLAFHGGTALRFLFNSRRYSEDLDFALEQHREWYALRKYLDASRSALESEGYQVALKLGREKTVNNAFVKFPGLPYEMGLSPHRQETIAVKIEVDTRPPAGARLETSIVRRHVTLHLQHHDRASLFAGKLHAILARPYLKGRDVYDLFWYLADRGWPSPNLTLLNNALQQSGWAGAEVTFDNWRHLVRQRLLGMDWQRIAGDIRPFLESADEVALLTEDNLVRLLG
jgi:hypothetical protein